MGLFTSKNYFTSKMKQLKQIFNILGLYYLQRKVSNLLEKYRSAIESEQKIHGTCIRKLPH